MTPPLPTRKSIIVLIASSKAVQTGASRDLISHSDQLFFTTSTVCTISTVLYHPVERTRLTVPYAPLPSTFPRFHWIVSGSSLPPLHASDAELPAGLCAVPLRPSRLVTTWQQTSECTVYTSQNYTTTCCQKSIANMAATNIITCNVGVGVQSIVISVSVCLSVCPFVFLKTKGPNFSTFSAHVMVVARSSSDGNTTVMYFRFCGWRHVFI